LGSLPGISMWTTGWFAMRVSPSQIRETGEAAEIVGTTQV
jgi:hypothetical protein